jgi:hypothetical protein
LEAGKKARFCTPGAKIQDSKDGCFTVLLQDDILWIWTAVTSQKTVLAERLTEPFTDFGQTIKRSLSDSVPQAASIDYAVMVSNLYEVTDHDDQPQNKA